MVLWDYLARHSYDSQIQRALLCEKMAEYTYNALMSLQDQHQLDLWVQRTPLALSVLFRQPKQDIVFKYSLSCESLEVNGKHRDYAHVYMMEHVTYEKIDALIADLKQSGAFDRPAEIDADHVSRTVTYGTARPMLHVPHVGRGWR